MVRFKQAMAVLGCSMMLSGAAHATPADEAGIRGQTTAWFIAYNANDVKTALDQYDACASCRKMTVRDSDHLWAAA